MDFAFLKNPGCTEIIIIVTGCAYSERLICVRRYSISKDRTRLANEAGLWSLKCQHLSIFDMYANCTDVKPALASSLEALFIESKSDETMLEGAHVEH